MNAHAPLLELRQVAKAYETAPAPTVVLKGVDLRVAPGEAVAIVGPSGCGKSTLLNLIGALDRPSGGAILFRGEDILRYSPDDAARFRNREIGFVLQRHHLLPQCTVLENVLVPTLVHPTQGGVRDRAISLLNRVGLAERIDRRPGQLSGGERQRVAVVRALINGPSLLLADEPTGALNEEASDALAALLIELNREHGMALVVVTHSVRFAEAMGRVLVLHDGVLKPKERIE
ncbi:MAG TPA: ABC transporter ATP-binding protein [Candidatus Hydrogenedentes bacterium]|nr:ABC transporter ATP-binding protein [Candidatus Hydrogenedentota bacterium]HPG66429.1 ABC transporter ATP-binding protein [Candidatus Hydrogenedentota bacterium]